MFPIGFQGENKVTQHKCTTRESGFFKTADVIGNGSQKITGNPLPQQDLFSNDAFTHGNSNTWLIVVLFCREINNQK